jgi:hypothetical protein
MQHSTAQANHNHFTTVPWKDSDYFPTSLLLCNWKMLRVQLLKQWTLISEEELDATGANCFRIAGLIAHRYNLNPHMLENYLRNFERTMPLI